MGNTRNTGYLQNAIKVSDAGAISFMSGSTMLATINTSGQMSGSSPVLSSSYALNADLLDGLDSTQFTLTSSFAAQTASFTAFTASVNSFTASQLVLNGKYATTGSNTFAGIQTINSNLVVTGSITAQTLVVQTITSSVSTITGSTNFGSLLANTHTFTGSMNLTGSLTVTTTGTELQINSTGVNLGNAVTDTHNITGSARISGSLVVNAGTTTVGVLTGSSAVFSGTMVVGGSSTIQQFSVFGANDPRAEVVSTGNNSAGVFFRVLNSGTQVGNATIRVTNGGILQFYNGTSTDALNFSIASNGAATFSSDIQGGGDLYFNKATRTTIYPTTTNQNLHIKSNGSGLLQFNDDVTGNITMCVGGGSVGIRTSVMSNGSVLNLFRTHSTNNYIPQLTIQGISNYNNMELGTFDQYDGYMATRGSDLRILAGLNNTTENRIIMFYTTFNGATSGAQNYERVRINHNGEFLVGTTTGTSTDPVHRIGNSAGTTYGRLMIQERVGVWISLNTGTQNYGTINLSGGVVVYGGQSDYRLKENIQPLSSGLDRVMSLKPVSFNWKRDNSYGEGFIAHELQEVVPLAVTGTKDGLNEVGDPDWQNVDKSHIVPILVKAIQEQQAQINELKAQING